MLAPSRASTLCSLQFWTRAVSFAKVEGVQWKRSCSLCVLIASILLASSWAGIASGWPSLSHRKTNVIIDVNQIRCRRYGLQRGDRRQGLAVSGADESMDFAAAHESVHGTNAKSRNVCSMAAIRG